jgi:hypothetical protein
MPGWQASLAEVTLPHVTRYADTIGADLNIISQRRFPDWPLSFEKHQIWEAGKGHDWNIYFDVDVLLHPDLDDFTLRHPPETVGNWWYRDIRGICEAERMDVFRADGRYYGVGDCFVATSHLTHGLWTPRQGGFEHYLPLLTTDDRSLITAFSLSFNLAQNRYPIQGALRDGAHLVYLGFKGDEIAGSREDAALAQLKQWGIAPLSVPVVSEAKGQIRSVTLFNVPSGEQLSAEIGALRKIPASSRKGSLTELLGLIGSADPAGSLVIALPEGTKLNESGEHDLRDLMSTIAGRPSPSMLMTGYRFADGGRARRETSAWNLKLMQRAAEYDVGFLDYDLFVSSEGAEVMFGDSGELSKIGVSKLSQHILLSLEHKIFSS